MSELPRLLFCCFDVVPAPHATARRLTEYLRRLGDRYQIVVLSVKTPDHSHIERYQTARLLRVPVGGGDLRSRMETFDRAVRRQLESEEYVLVHFFDPVAGYPLCELRQDYGFKLVYDACRFPSGDLPSLQPSEGSNKRMQARSRRQELFCLMNADAVIVGSEAAQANVVALGVPAERISVVRAPIDLAPYAPDALGTPDGDPMRLVHLGSHGAHVDLPMVLEALSRTSAPTKLAIVGPAAPELTPGLTERIAELKLKERVDLQDPVAYDDLHKVLAAADVGLVTLTDEPRNRTGTALARVGEYLAAGRPMIAADLPLTRELCPAAATRFYAPHDPGSLAQAIDALASDPALRKAMGTAARAMVAAVDSRLAAERVQSIYVKVAPAAQPPADAHVELGHSDATQLGAPVADAHEPTQAAIAIADIGTNKVKTDPALEAQTPDADTGTDQTAQRERPPIMGRLLRDLPTEHTDPAAPRRDPPMVMGTPVTDELQALSPLAPRSSPPVADVQPALGDTPSAPTDMALALSRVPSTDPGVPPVAGVVTPAAVAPPVAEPPAPALLSSTDDEPLDFSNLLKPTIAVPRPPVTAPPAKAPVPIVVPTSFTLARPSTPRASSPSSANLAVAATAPTAPPVSLGPPVLAPASSPSQLGPPVLPPASSPSQLGPPVLPPASSPSQLGPPVLPPASSPSQLGPPSSRTVAPVASPATSGLAATGTLPGPRTAPPVLSPVRVSPSGIGPPPLPISPSGVRGPPPLPASPSGVRSAPVPTGQVVPIPVLSPVAAQPVRAAEPVEVRDDEVELVNDESFTSLHDGDDDDAAEREIDGGELQALETSAAPPPSRLDPWFAQLVHGYCPPESQLFTRHVPPTTMPGRDT